MSPASTDRRARALPTTRPSRAVVEAVRPVVDGGRFAAKATLGEPLPIVADVFADGHDVVDAVVQWRHVGATGRAAAWREVTMERLGNDRFRGWITPDRLGRIEYDVIGWIDHLESWRRGVVKKIEAGLDVSVELLTGARLLADVVDAGVALGDDRSLDDHRLVDGLRRRLLDGDHSTLDDDGWTAVFARTSTRTPSGRLPSPLPVDVDPLRGAFGAWYEFFPRSSAEADVPPPRTLRDSIRRLDHIAKMGFDVVYLPPIHPIGRVNRKGRNNTLLAASDDVGSPWAIGAEEGGHKSVHTPLGTLADFEQLVARAHELGIEMALDIAYQCAPDHPYVRQHPAWFRWRPDGTVQYAENPPKKYQDIYPFDFESDDWQGLWRELADVMEFWIGAGVKIFRVDNPHTKAFAFWEWAIAQLKRSYPDVLFLSEAFTRPKVMHRLAKLGFTQSYTYFAWRNTRQELTDYFTELAHGPGRDYFRPNVWPNTPDILTEALQFGGRPMFMSRLVLAATLSASYGIYGPAYEHMEAVPREPGSEEYLHSEKYELREWNLTRPDSLAPFIARVNLIRRENAALHGNDSLRFLPIDNPQLIAYAKSTPALDNVLICVVNLDPHHRQAGWLTVDLAALGIDAATPFQAHDLLTDAHFLWQGARNYVELDPQRAPAHIFRLRRRVRREQDFDYFL